MQCKNLGKKLCTLYAPIIARPFQKVLPVYIPVHTYYTSFLALYTTLKLVANKYVFHILHENIYHMHMPHNTVYCTAFDEYIEAIEQPLV